MRQICTLCLLLLSMPVTHAQPVKSKPRQYTCEVLCAELFASIRGNPETMEMRLEEALVINESCAAEIVTTAIDAVNSEPRMVRKIVATALDLAPRRANAITAAVQGYRTHEVAAAIPVVRAPAPAMAATEEIRRAELPEFIRPKPAAGEEVRRAQLPTSPIPRQPFIEVRRAELPPATALRTEPTRRQERVPAARLMNIPRAQPLKPTGRR